jgi:hypothetical protein
MASAAVVDDSIAPNPLSGESPQSEASCASTIDVSADFQTQGTVAAEISEEKHVPNDSIEGDGVILVSNSTIIVKKDCEIVDKNTPPTFAEVQVDMPRDMEVSFQLYKGHMLNGSV